MLNNITVQCHYMNDVNGMLNHLRLYFCRIKIYIIFQKSLDIQWDVW